MNTRNIAVEYRLSHWAQVIQERSTSGLSIKSYCESAGIHENTYYYWLKKLREASIEGIAATNDVPQPMSPVRPVFAELKLPPRSDEEPHATDIQNQICIEAAGVKLTAGGGYPIVKLTELLREVMRTCC